MQTVTCVTFTSASRSNGEDKVECLAGNQKTGFNLVAVWRKSVDWRVTFVEVWIV